MKCDLDFYRNEKGLKAALIFIHKRELKDLQDFDFDKFKEEFIKTTPEDYFGEGQGPKPFEFIFFTKMEGDGVVRCEVILEITFTKASDIPRSKGEMVAVSSQTLKDHFTTEIDAKGYLRFFCWTALIPYEKPVPHLDYLDEALTDFVEGKPEQPFH